MAVETPDTEVHAGDHVVQFYAHDSELVATVGPYLAAGAQAGEIAIVIATEVHRRAFAAKLKSEGVDYAQAVANGRLIPLDAAATIATFMADEQVDRDAFHETVGELVRRATACGRPVRAYGEMVALLWDAGNVLAAIELETLWNELARELTFSLFCAYPAAAVSGSEHGEALQQICHLHTAVIPSPANALGKVSSRPFLTEVTGRFAAVRDAPRNARHMCVAALREWGRGERLIEDAALVLSELATNAVVHAGSPFSMVVRVEGSKLRIAVRDESPERDGHGLVAQTGHGLGLIELIAHRWGVEYVPGGKVVWAELHA